MAHAFQNFSIQNRTVHLQRILSFHSKLIGHSRVKKKLIQDFKNTFVIDTQNKLVSINYYNFNF